MDRPLTTNGILGAPPFLESSLFGPFADRTVALIAIAPIQDVPLGTVSLLCVDSADAAAPQGIFPGRETSQMFGPDTGTMVTNVIDHITRWDIANRGPIRHAMSPAVQPAEGIDPIPIAISHPEPEPTITHRGIALRESRPLLICHAVHVGHDRA